MKTILITGSAGFIGTNLTISLLKKGHHVIGVDNFLASEKWKVKLFEANKNYHFIECDISTDSKLISEYAKLKNIKFDEIYNLACPASPPRYQKLPLETIAVCTNGLINILNIAKEHNSKIFHASTSEIYGNPIVHPQKENYFGNVNTVGPRSCYDEGKRIGETICYEYFKNYSMEIKMARIFNTYGPYMDEQDGRVITNFILHALRDKNLPMYGDGSYTRSFQYIDDLLSGIEKLMNTEKEFLGPINLGNPNEFTMKELADLIIEKTNSNSKISFFPAKQDDPQQRRPDITFAKEILKWEPSIELNEGLDKTIAYFKSRKNDN